LGDLSPFYRFQHPSGVFESRRRVERFASTDFVGRIEACVGDVELSDET
jgi:hypothetical protein